jgi:hypothetical protein
MVPNMTKIIGEEGLNSIRSLDELHEYLPVEAGGLMVTSALSKEGQEELREALKTRTALVRFVSTTPQMGEIGRRYDPIRVKEYITKILKKKHETDPLDPVFYEFEGIETEPTFRVPFADKAKGHTTPLHLAEQMINMGPTGNEFKRGAEPLDKVLYEKAIEATIRKFKSHGIDDLVFSHAVLCTEDSDGSGVPMATLKDKSAGWPPVLDMSKRPRKGNHIRESLRRLSRIMKKGSRSLLMYPGVVYKRFDRMIRLRFFSEQSKLGDFNREARDRAIVAQSFPSQIGEAVALRPMSKAVQKSKMPEIALRTPYHTSAELKNMDSLSHVECKGKMRAIVRYCRFLMGLDTSHWDQQVPPQFWYGFLRVALALFKPIQRVGYIYSDEFVVFDKETQRRLESLAPGKRHKIMCRIRATLPSGDVIEEEREYDAEMFEIDTESYLRRIFAGASGNDIVVGDIKFSGYKYTYVSPDGRKWQVGWGQRSGNWSTFLGNSVMNMIVDPYFEFAVEDDVQRQKFRQEYGYELPKKFRTLRSLIAGDDKVVLVELDPEFAALVEDGVISTKELCADMLTFIGQKVNAKKQEGSGRMGPGYAGFAQMLVHQGKVHTRLTDLFDKFFWRETDEATGIDPLTGKDYRHLLGDLGNHARIANTSGSFGRDPHPWLETGLGILQDLDVPEGVKTNRLLPPKDSEERAILTRLYNSKMARRGQTPHGVEGLLGFWDTPGPVILEDRFTMNQSKLSGPWNPIVKGRPPRDARSEWRKRPLT